MEKNLNVEKTEPTRKGKMSHIEWLYVFGFATHVLQFKAIEIIGKTDIYNVLADCMGFLTN